MSVLSRRRFLKIMGAGAAAFMPPTLLSAKPRKQPDILIIVGDDIGFSDFGCYGGEIPTPNIDRIAQEGLRFTHFHAENMCAPTRVCLLTGQYHVRGYQSGTNVTIPEALSAAGYHSCAVGKWHNAGEPIMNRKAPQERGFNHFYGTPQGCGSFYAPLTLTRDGQPAEKDWRDNADFYYTDAIAENAAQYVKQTPRDTPLFLYTAFTAAHWPLHARPADIEKQKGRYAMGWDKLREQRLKRMKKLGIIKPDTPLSPRHPDVPAWKDEPHKAWQQRRMEVYAAQIASMDANIGKIIAALRDTGRLENTLVMVLVDNGACHVEYGPDRKGPFLNSKTRDGRPMRVGNLPDIMPGPEDTWQSYGYGWANASNTPYRLFKQYDHEGGIRVPFIVRWPGQVKDKGGLTNQVAHLIDILPTLLDVAETPYPKTFDSRPIAPSDGLSMTPIFRGQQRQGHDALYFRNSHGRAVRQGDWKLVKKDKNPWELYNLKTDPIEVNDLSKKKPQKATDLQTLWEDWYDHSQQGNKEKTKKKNNKKE